MSGLVFSTAIAAAFNLTCPVAVIQHIGDMPPVRGTLVKQIRIDLKTNRWCDGVCHETKPISRVSERELILQREAQPDIHAYDSEVINRESGSYVSHHRINDVSYDETGTCSRKPFTGFPSKRF